MAMFGFGRKKEAEEQEPAAPGSPLGLIMAMKQRGMGNDQIVQELERQGYNSSQIFDALNQANLSGMDAPYVAPGMGTQQPPMQDFGQQPYMQQPVQQFEQPAQQQMDRDRVEEIVEAIIDEKWKEFERDIKLVIDWKDKTESKIDQMSQQISDLAGSLNTLQKSIIGKVSEYDKNLSNVGVEIKAMEKVFQNVLPSLTENVNKLERMSKGYKPAGKKED